MDKFGIYCDRFMGMKKADIIAEGQAWGFWADRASTAASLMKWSKFLLAIILADKIDKFENRGY